MIELKTAMMGLQATSTKRKYEIGACGETGEIQANCSPAKASRWSTENGCANDANVVADAVATTATVATSTTTTTAAATTAAAASTTATMDSSPINSVAVNRTTTNTTASNLVTPMIPSAEESIAKLEAVAAVEPWSAEPIVDSISRLQAVAVPDTWGSDSSRSALATTLLSADDLEEDDDDFEDDFDEEESIIPSYSPLRYPCTPSQHMPRPGYMSPTSNGYPKPSYYSEPYPQQNCSRTPYTMQYGNRSLPMNHIHYGWSHHHPHHPNYYGPPPPDIGNSQQTIRCAENGKSYLELGSSNYGNGADTRHPKRCCDGRSGSWCNNNKQCYRERRLKMRNLSMFKLSRFRQVSEQSLYRSVLICNTLKYIDREIEIENKETASQHAEFHAQHPHHYAHLRLNGNDMRHHLMQQPPPQQHLAPPQQPSVQHMQPPQPNVDRQTQQQSPQTPSSPQQMPQSTQPSQSQQQQQPPQQQQQQPTQATIDDDKKKGMSNGLMYPYSFISSTPTTTSVTNNSINGTSDLSKSPYAPPTNVNNSNINNNNTNNNSNSSNSNHRLTTPITSMSFNEALPPYDHHPLRDTHQSGRVTPFPDSCLPDTDSGYGDEDVTKPINWGSVLSLSSQSALDPLNNNDLFSTSTTSCSLLPAMFPTTCSTPSRHESNVSISTSSVGCSTTPSSSTSTISISSTSVYTGLSPAPPSPTSVTPSNLEYNLLDMDLGLGPELTELLPSWKLTPLSADDILKSVTTPMEPTKMSLENEMDSLTHIMVGGS